MAKPQVDSAAWWAEHGVSAEVRSARPYTRWTTENVEAVREAYADLSVGQQRTLRRWARQSDGLVIYRHSFEQVPAGELRYVYPEIRPDQPIRTQTIWHYHGPARSKAPRHPSSGNPLPKKDVHEPSSMQRHIGRDRAPDDHHGVSTDEVHCHEEMAKYLFPPSATMTVPWIHSHRDEYWARVHLRLFPGMDENGEVVKADTTDEQREQLEEAFANWLEQHMRKHHPGMDAAQRIEEIRELGGLTRHEHSLRVKRSDEQLAKRIDVNPLVWRNGGIEQAERVFFGIEGCIKADAILTALLESGQAPAVFSVPSVSLWEATYPAVQDETEGGEVWAPDDEDGSDPSIEERPPEFTNYQGDELAAFASRYLLGKLVCIVPDADAHTKPEVMTQALLCRSTLRRLGARAEIVLPPDNRLKQGIKGIDDYLGKGGGNLDGLVWYRKEPPPEDHLETWLLRARGSRWRSDGLERAVLTLQALATHAADNGEYTASIRQLARATGRRKQSPSQPTRFFATEPLTDRELDNARKKFERGIKEDLLQVGAITTNKPLDVRIGQWLRRNSGWHKQGGLHWAEDGVVITLHPDLRAPAERRSIRDLA